MTFSATYDPADDKLRLSASSRLDKDMYARVKDAGFGWAPKQEVFYAVWSPNREDLMIELAGEIGDEDTTLVERAEVRADRFEDYSEKRAEDAHRAKDAVERIADGIPFGQPILVGHHSERHARKDAEKIRSGMDRAVKMWETANYWKSRAAGAVRAAKYKELPAVRARRIKGLEADIRSYVASYTPHDGASIMQTPWRWEPSSRDLEVEQIAAERVAAEVPHVFVGPKGRGCYLVAQDSLPRIEAGAQRWLNHLRNRLEYEKAMLADGGGLVADKFEFAVGGRVSGGGDWYVVTGLNRKDGALLSLSVAGRYCSTMQIEEVRDYRAPEAGDAEKVKAAKKLPPLVNYRAPRCIEMTSAEWKQKTKCSDSYFAAHFDAEGNHTWGRVKDGEKPIAYRQRSKVSIGSGYNRVPVFLSDAKIVEPPKVAVERPGLRGMLADLPREERPVYQRPEPTEFDAMKDSLRSGTAVQVVSAPQLFPTPKALARRMVEIAGIMGGERVLEPSAGTGIIVREIHNGFTGADNGRVVAVEMSGSLVAGLEQTRNLTVGANESNYEIVHGDFLDQNGNLGKFDAVLMNPPFVNGSDIKHIQHAVKFLKPGGVLVAICANGPRQREVLQGIAEHWEDLPAGTFAEQGTGVNTALLVLRGE